MRTASSLTERDLASAAQVERRARILDAAIALAADGGFEAVQMRSVAEQADVALGTLYRYFPSKIHLLVSALARELEQTAGWVTAAPVPGATSADRVARVLEGLSRTLQDHERVAEALTRAFMFADRTVEQEIGAVVRALSAMLTHAMRPGADPSDDELGIARVIADVWFSSLVGWVSGRASAADTARHVDRAVRLILR